MNATADRHAFFRSRPSATRRHTYTDQERPPRGGGAQPRKSGRCPALASRRTYLLHADTCGNPPYRPADAPLSKGLFALPLEINGETEGDKGRSRTRSPAHHRGRATQSGNQDWSCLARVLFHPHFHFATPQAGLSAGRCAAEPKDARRIPAVVAAPKTTKWPKYECGAVS